MDATFDFEKKRNRPVKCVVAEGTFLHGRFWLSCSSIIACCRYDRNHIAVTLRGIQKVTETRHKREADYHTLRMTKHVRCDAQSCFPESFETTASTTASVLYYSFHISFQQDACAAA